MQPRCSTAAEPNGYVTLPCQRPEWPNIKRHLRRMVAQDLNCNHKLVSALNDLYVLVHGEDEGVLCHRGVFDGLETFLRLTATREETVNFFVVILPCIVQRAVDIEDLQPDEGLAFSRQQQDGETCLSRSLVASIVACSFLCLFQGGKTKRHSKLSAINFDDFFKHLSSVSQCEKLRCILNYFERIALDPGGPSGYITFRRQVVPPDDLPCIIDWLTCDQPLCPVQVCHSGKIKDAKSHFIKVNFAQAMIGGEVLGAGCAMEEISFCASPELIAAALFMERMLDNEAIIIHGFETFSQCAGHGKALQFSGSYFDPTMKDSKGNLENALCAIDALPLGQYSSTGKQYGDHFLLRELNKAWVGFQQPWCTGEPAHTGSNRDSVVTSEEYYSAVEALNDEAAAACHSSPSMEEDNGNACARCIPGPSHGNGFAGPSTRKTSHTNLFTRSCDYVETQTAETRTTEKATSDGNKHLSLTHATSDMSSIVNRDIDTYACGSSLRSEISSEFDEYFESTQHPGHPYVILQDKTPRKKCAPVVQSFVGSLVTQSFHDGCQAAVGMLPRVETFSSTQPNNLVKPKAVRPSGLDRTFKGEGHGGIGRRGNLIDLNNSGFVDNVVEPLANNSRANEASASDIAQFATDLLMNTFSSAVLNVRSHLETRNSQYARLAGNIVDESLQDAVATHQQRRRTVSEGLASVGGRGDGRLDSSSVFRDGAIPSFIEECLSDEMKVKLMEMVASQHARVDVQRQSGAGYAHSEATQAGYNRGYARMASSDRGSQRTSAMRPARDSDASASVNPNRQATGHWNVPTIRIYPDNADLTETVNVRGATNRRQSGARDEMRSPGRLSLNDGHNRRCSCPHCVVSVDGYVDMMIDDVMTESYDAIMENQCDEAKEQLARFTFHSPDGAVEPDLHRFAGRLVHLAMRDAMRLIRRANKHVQRCRHRSQGRVSSPRPEVAQAVERSDLFSRGRNRLSLQNSSLVPISAPSFDTRRCSLDETRSLQLSTNHCSSFRDVILSDFDDELRNSSVRSPNLHLFESEDAGSFLHCSQRRASEPIHSMKQDLIAESTTKGVVHSVACDRSAASSTEVVLGWLNSSDWGGRSHREHRTADHASNLNDYVNKLITDIFDSTYSELFDRDPHIPQARESKPVCDTQLFTRLWHGPRAAHCSPPGGVGSNSDTKLLMSDYFPIPAPFHSLNVMAAVMAGHIVRDAVRAVSAQRQRDEPKFLRPIATGNWGCGSFGGDPQLKAMLQWAAASRVQVPTMNYYSLSDHRMQQFASVCRKIERRGLTIGDLLKLVVDYCHRREDKYNYTERSLFDDLTRNNND